MDSFRGVRCEHNGVRRYACSMIDGLWADASAQKTKLFEVRNPATGAVIGCAASDVPPLDLIERSARLAQKTWFFDVTEQEKEAVFRAIIRLLEDRRGVVARTMVLEGGKLWKWADAEAQETLDTLWHYHGELSRYHTNDGFMRCQMPDKNSFSILKPHGVVLGDTPWNFPLAVPMWKICGALAGGNAIVVKDAEQTPFTLTLMVELIHRAIREVITDQRQKRLAGLVQLIHGDGRVGEHLVRNLNYNYFAFTGSSEVGNIVAGIAGSRGISGHKECGGHAAMVVLDDFDVDLAVAEAVNANLGDSGQRCVSTRVVFVQESLFNGFFAEYLRRARTRIIGDPMKSDVEMGPLISQEQMDRVRTQVAKTASQLGRKALIGGGPHLLSEKTGGYYYEPTVFTNVPYSVTAMDEEIFGPVLVINTLEGATRREAYDNAVRLVNQSRFGLSNALLTNDRRLASRAPWDFESGLFYVGRGTTGAEVGKYFGGVKQSGWGREGRGLDAWTTVMQVYDDYHGKPRMAQAGADDAAQERIAGVLSPLG